MKKYFFLIIACLFITNIHAAYLKNIPKTLTQPDGSVLHCYASGDEFFNYLHDKNGFTIIQHPQTGFFVYANLQDGKLVATEFVAGKVDPASKSLRPYNLISPEEWTARRTAWQEKEKRTINRNALPNHGTLNNISIFIRFSDDSEFTNTYSSIDNMFNDESDNAISMKTYFRAASYGSIEIPTYFYPGHNGETIISYQDTYPRSYFQPYNSATNTNGYQSDGDRTEREFSLLERAVNYINANYPIPTDLNIDYDNDGYVDNVCFIVRGTTGEWSSLLWPHKWALYDRTVLINGKQVWTFNFQLADATGYFNTSVMCHEMNHSLSAPDLYHYSYSGPDAVGIWDLMHNNTTPPQHCGAYMKMKYGHWIDEIPEITQAGTYTLNPISSATPTNIAYKIKTDNPNQFYVLEYRDNTSLFETGLPGSGLLIYRIDTRFEGNADYDPSNGIYDEVYIFRPGGTTTANGNLNSAHFSSNTGRTEFSSSTTAYPFFSDGTIDDNFRIFNITSAGSTISFTYGNSADCEPPTNLVASVDDHDVTLSWDASLNAVSYNIYRNGNFIGNTNETSYLDHNVPYGSISYYLKSVDANGLFSTSSEVVTVNIELEGAIVIGDGGSATNDYLPSYSYYNYALTQQIYTADEIGTSGTITSISFYNDGAEKTRSYDIYLVDTQKTAFDNANDWITVTEDQKVFSGEVVMLENNWTIIYFDTPFEYDNKDNLAIIVDDNSGNWTNEPHMSCRVYNASDAQAIRVYNDNNDYNPMDPTSYNGAVLNVKNQLLLTMEQNQIVYSITVNAAPIEGGTVTTDSESSANKYFYDFEDGTLQGWTYFQGTNGDSPNNWVHSFDYTTHDLTTGHGHNASNGFLISESLIQNDIPVHPDNYLVSPQILLGGNITFWATNFDNEYGAEHFAVTVSTESNTNANDFTTVQEWTLLAEKTGGTRTIDDGIWNEYHVDLNTFSGLGYVAIRHYDCYDQWLLCVDDISIEEGAISTYNQGEFCTVTATANEGYTFVNWTENGEVVSTEAIYSFEVTNDRVLIANFNLNQYDVTATPVPVEGGTVSTGSDSSTSVYNYDFEDGTSQGWTFLQGTNGDSPNNWIHCADYTTNVFANGYGHNASDGFFISESFIHNSTSVHPDNYLVSPRILLGGNISFWATNLHNDYGAEHFAVAVSTNGNTDANDFTTVEEWTLPVEKTGGTRTIDDGVWYEYSVDLGAFNGLGYVAIHHFDCYGQWLLCVDDITIVEGTAVVYSDSYNHGESCTLIATANEGYTFVNWTENGEVVSTEATYSFEVTNDRDLIANFNLNQYNVTATPIPLEGGTVTNDSESTTTVFNYDFEDGTLQGWTIFQGPNGDSPDNWMHCVNYTANDFSTGFGHNASNGFLLSESFVQNNTPVHPDNYLVSPRILLGGSINFWATNLDNEYGAEHFEVAVSTEGNTEADDFTTVMEWTLSVEKTGGTRTIDDGIWYEYSVDLSAFSGLGYVAIHHFDCYEQWLLCIDDITIVEGTASVYYGTYNHGESCTLIATANEGYTFVNWTENGEEVSTDATYSFEVTGDRNLIANFEAFSPIVGQTYELTQGWNWWSTNLDITLEQLQAALVDALPGTTISIKSKDRSITYNGNTWRGNLHSLDITQMYKIKISAGCEVTLNGTPINPAEHPVTIHSGVNWIGFPLNENMTLNYTFNGFATNNDMVKSKNLSSSYNGSFWRGTLNNLVPGQGYIYKSTVSEDRIFTFPTSTK